MFRKECEQLNATVKFPAIAKPFGRFVRGTGGQRLVLCFRSRDFSALNSYFAAFFLIAILSLLRVHGVYRGGISGFHGVLQENIQSRP